MTGRVPTFDDFVIGRSNRFAHAAALAVAGNPAGSYNPLLIHGKSGLGKTHLLHAIGNHVRGNLPTRQVHYVSTETFVNEFVDAIRATSTIDFKRHYRGCDVLLVDDIQLIEGNESLQEEFFHTFNYLCRANRQIVLASNRPPESIATLDERLRTRLLSYISVEILGSELPTRARMLADEARRRGVVLSDEAAVLVAQALIGDGYPLLGVLNDLTFWAREWHEPVSASLADWAIRRRQ